MPKREHELVPLHRIMSRTEVKEMLNSLSLTANNLPKMLITDAQSKKLSAKVGDVIEIEREDAGKSYKHYRHVVES